MQHKVTYSVVRLLLLMAFLGSGAFVVLHDVVVYIDGGRPWFAVTDDLCSVFLYANRNNVVAETPVAGSTVVLDVSHQWRGKYQLKLWIPENGDVTTSDKKLGVRCLFYNKNGVLIFSQEFHPSTHSSWHKIPNRTGSFLSFWMYIVPEDVPLDDEIRVVVHMLGDFDRFRLQHPISKLFLIKERDK